jgi:hypothetical protein
MPVKSSSQSAVDQTFASRTCHHVRRATAPLFCCQQELLRFVRKYLKVSYSHPISSLPSLFSFSNNDDFSDNFVSGNDREAVAKSAVFDDMVRVANTTSQHLDQDLVAEISFDLNHHRPHSCGSHTSPGLGSSSLKCLKTRDCPLASKTAALYSVGS